MRDGGDDCFSCEAVAGRLGGCRRRLKRLLADRENLERNVKTLRVGAFDLAVEAAREREDVELLELLSARATREKGKAWRQREDTVKAAYQDVKESRARRFTWQPGDVEVVPADQVVEAELELPPAVQKVLDARNEKARKLQEGREK